MQPELRTAFIDRSDNSAAHAKQVKFSVLQDGTTMIEFFVSEASDPAKFIPNREMDNQGYRCMLLFYSNQEGPFEVEMRKPDGAIVEVPAALAFATDEISNGVCYAPTTVRELTPLWGGLVPDGFARLVVIKPHRWEHEVAKFGHTAESFRYGSGPHLIPRHLLCLPAAVKEWRELTESITPT